MDICRCYSVSDEIIGWIDAYTPKTIKVSRCNGTRERDECSCNGNPEECTHYLNVKNKALKEREPKFGEWISVEDKLPNHLDGCLVYDKYDNFWVCYYDNTRRSWADSDGYKHSITHWMPLPQPPKGE